MSYYYKYYKYKQKYNNLLGGSEDCGNCGGMFCEICAGKQSNDESYDESYDESLVKAFEEEEEEKDDFGPTKSTTPENVSDDQSQYNMYPGNVSEDQSLDNNNIKCCGVFNDIQRGTLCALHACNNLLQSMDSTGEEILKHYCQEELKVATDKNRDCTGNFIDTVVYQYLIRRSELCTTGDGKDFDVHPNNQPFFKLNDHKTAMVLEENPVLAEILAQMDYNPGQIEYGLKRSTTLDGAQEAINKQIYDPNFHNDDDDEYPPIWKVGYFLSVNEPDLLREFTHPDRTILEEGKSLLGYIIKVPGHYIAIRLRNSEEDCKQYCFIDSQNNYIKNGDATDMISELKTHSKCWGKTRFEDDNIQQFTTKPMVIKVLSVD